MDAYECVFGGNELATCERPRQGSPARRWGSGGTRSALDPQAPLSKTDSPVARQSEP